MGLAKLEHFVKVCHKQCFLETLIVQASMPENAISLYSLHTYSEFANLTKIFNFFARWILLELTELTFVSLGVHINNVVMLIALWVQSHRADFYIHIHTGTHTHIYIYEKEMVIILPFIQFSVMFWRFYKRDKLLSRWHSQQTLKKHFVRLQCHDYDTVNLERK